MGMFDYVRSAIPLPDGFDGELQSKDFDCEMATIEIREDGTLWIERFEYEEVPLAERPYPDPEDPMRFVGSIRRINERWEPLNHHGMFNFYGGYPGPWHEYDAKFTDGKLVEIVAQAIEAQSGEPGTGSTEGESAVGNADASKE